MRSTKTLKNIAVNLRDCMVAVREKSEQISGMVETKEASEQASNMQHNKWVLSQESKLAICDCTCYRVSKSASQHRETSHTDKKTGKPVIELQEFLQISKPESKLARFNNSSNHGKKTDTKASNSIAIMKETRKAGKMQAICWNSCN